MRALPMYPRPNRFSIFALQKNGVSKLSPEYTTG